MIIPIYKPAGMTSHDVAAKLKRAFPIKPKRTLNKDSQVLRHILSSLSPTTPVGSPSADGSLIREK